MGEYEYTPLNLIFYLFCRVHLLFYYYVTVFRQFLIKGLFTKYVRKLMIMRNSIGYIPSRNFVSRLFLYKSSCRVSDGRGGTALSVRISIRSDNTGPPGHLVLSGRTLWMTPKAKSTYYLL